MAIGVLGFIGVAIRWSTAQPVVLPIPWRRDEEEEYENVVPPEVSGEGGSVAVLPGSVDPPPAGEVCSFEAFPIESGPVLTFSSN